MGLGFRSLGLCGNRVRVGPPLLRRASAQRSCVCARARGRVCVSVRVCVRACECA